MIHCTVSSLTWYRSRSSVVWRQRVQVSVASTARRWTEHATMLQRTKLPWLVSMICLRKLSG